MDYNVVSSDDHVQEPGDLWIKRAPAKLRDRVPVLKRTAEGDCWFLDGKMTGNLGMSVQAGHKFEEYKASKVYWEEARKGCWDPNARMKDMDINGVDAQVLFPNLGIGPLFLLDDFELQFACLRALQRFPVRILQRRPQAPDRNRLIPTDDVKTGVEEIKHCAKLTGLRGGCCRLIRAASRSTAAPTSRYGRRRKTRAADAYPSAHRSRQTAGLLGQNGELIGEKCAILNLASLANYEALSRIVFGGVLERHPKLKFVSVEGNIGWLGYWLEKSDRTYKRHRHWTKLELPNRPATITSARSTRPLSRTRSAC